jgi:hypothetical protein
LAGVISPQRAEALNIANMASRLLDEKYFDECANAVKTGNKILFLNKCTEAKIPPDVAEKIWAIVGQKKVAPGEMVAYALPGGW